ncbi:hypothetical protein WUBG_00539 [Wuchereria bancrofti]|uniref:Uncharacterized protein n=1 Tax=Wuchereria bancrofti TaxID=6293 RepID=J9FMG6_WUCBA|nr:hypothetical protein WUBG_00539 [Wuchereria bancrofti]VDM07552.1 unnamed protein product [Wuchereria bancrofti]
MTMLATVHPYSSNNKSSSNNSSDADKHIMKITDVTDQYLEEKDGEVQEGSLVEYCRIDHHENAKYRPEICLADRIVKITSLEHDDFKTVCQLHYFSTDRLVLNKVLSSKNETT